MNAKPKRCRIAKQRKVNTPTKTLNFQPKVELRPTTSLHPFVNNARTHSDRQIHQIAESIKQFGFTNPLLIDSQGGIIAGHGRWEAAKLLGMNEVPTIRLDHLTVNEKRAYILADNKLAELGGWDQEILAIELESLSGLDLGFDLNITGFETYEIDQLLQPEVVKTHHDPADKVPEPDLKSPPISKPGDVWILGVHRLICGNALEGNTYEALMQGDKAQLVFTDPPYNVAIHGHVCGSGKIKHENFLMASGEMSETEFTAFLEQAFSHLSTHSTEGSIHFICMDWRHMLELMSAGRKVYAELKNLCVWNKDNGGMGTFYRSKHELVFVFKNGSTSHTNNFALGQHGRYRTNVWDYPGVNTLKPGRNQELEMHPTVKPVSLVMDAIKDCSHRGGVVLDAFVGSGTTLISAERTGRVGRGIEMDPRYVDVALKRWKSFSGEEAIHAATGMTFKALAEARAGSGEGTDSDQGKEALHG